MKQYSSIFNDVLGPVMCGLSSSHTAAPNRIGQITRQLLGSRPVRMTVTVDPDGTAAPGLRSHNSDVGITAGVMGIGLDDTAVFDSIQIAESSGIKVEFVLEPLPGAHQNTYVLELEDEDGKQIRTSAVSWGGGTMEVIDINGFCVSLEGGFYETFAVYDDGASWIETEQIRTSDAMGSLTGMECLCEILENDRGQKAVHISTEEPVDGAVLRKAFAKATNIMTAAPVFPNVAQITPHVPFRNYREMMALASEMASRKEPERRGVQGEQMPQLWEMAVLYEGMRSGKTEQAVFEDMRKLTAVYRDILRNGLAGTHYEKRILGAQSLYFNDAKRKARLIRDEYVNRMIQYISAYMEVHSSKGVIVASPTGGTAGEIPGPILAVADIDGLDEEQVVKAFLAAGLIGVFINEESTFAAEIMGCQAECGAASGMTAAALVQLMGGTLKEACDAASMALQNVFGLTCEPVCMGVEVPCLGKNIMGSMNAFAMANMALIGYDAVVPFDETLEKFDTVGHMIPPPIRCTGGEGLCKTPTSIKLRQEVFGGE